MSTYCREQWSFEKKIKKARAKKNKSLADSLAQRRPNYRIDHLVKERQGSLACSPHFQQAASMSLCFHLALSEHLQLRAESDCMTTTHALHLHHAYAHQLKCQLEQFLT